MTGQFTRPRSLSNLLLLVLGLFLGVLPGNVSAQGQGGPAGPAGAARQAASSGKVVVAFADSGQTEAEVAAELAARGLQLEKWLPELGLARAIRQSGSAAAAAGALSADPAIDFVTDDRMSAQVAHLPPADLPGAGSPPADVPQDEYWGEQWGPAKVGLPAARTITWGDASAVIAVVDTGANYWHWDLRDQVWINPGESEVDAATGKRTCSTGIAVNGQDDDNNGFADDCRGYDFVAGDNDPNDVYGHGTAVAGIASAATNNFGHYGDGKYEGVAGMGGAARVMILRALGDKGGGSPFNIADAITYAANQGATVINLSLTLDVNYAQADADMLCRATAYAQGQGSIVVAASGNHSAAGIQPVSYPAACPGVVAVGASSQADTRSWFSDAGSRLDLVAPGEGIFSLLRTTNTSYGRFNGTGNGTSFASPHVAGAAALVRSLRPDLGPSAVRDLLRNTSDDVGDPGFDAATGAGRLNVERAVSAALDGLSLKVTADPPGMAVGSRGQVRVQVTGPGGAPAGFGARISLAGTLGVVSPPLVTADDHGAATATFTAGAVMGTGSATATLGPLGASVPITVSSGVPASIRVASDPPVLPINGRSTITAAVLDEGGNPVANPFDVMFSASLGVIDPISVRTVGGAATTTFNAGAAKGAAVIQASAAGLSGSLPIPILGAGDPFTVTVAASPGAALAGGPDVDLAASVVDSSGAAVPDGTVVAFSTDLGALSAPSAITKAGKAAVRLSPGTVAGLAHVRAKAGLVQGSAAITVVAGPVTAVDVSAAPQELMVGDGQLATITAVAWDQFGNVAADGVVIQFSTTLGELVTNSAPIVNGRSEVQLMAGTVAGSSQVTATAPGGARDQVTVVVRPGAPAQLALTALPLELTVGGGASRLRATVKDAYGNLAASGIPITFVTDLGVLQPAGGGPGVGASVIVPTNAGVSEVDLAPGTVAGIAQVTASVAVDPDHSLQAPVQLTIRAAGAAQVVLSAQPALVRPGGRVDIAAHVSDQYGNPVGDGINVTFGVSRGQLYQSIVPTADGVAYTWFSAPAGSGPVQVYAIAEGISGVPVSVQVARSTYLPTIQR